MKNRYSDTEFPIFNQGLSKHEIKKLTDAIKLLQQVKGIDLNNELLDILYKLDMEPETLAEEIKMQAEEILKKYYQ